MLMTAPQSILCDALKGTDEQCALEAVAALDKLDFFNEEQLLPLHLACQKPWPKVVQAILDKGATSNIKTLEGKTALHLAQANNLLEVAECLVRHNPMLRTLGDRQGQTPIHEAAKDNKMNFLACYLESRINDVCSPCNVNVQDDKKSTPLHEAAKMGHVDAVKLLLAHNANSELCDDAANKPFAYADALGFVEIATVLAEKGKPTLFSLAAVHVVDDYENSADVLPEIVFAAASSTVTLMRNNQQQQATAEREVLAARQAAIQELQDETALQDLKQRFAALGFK